MRRLPLWVLLGLILLQPTPHRLSQTVAGDLGDSMFLTWTLSWGARALTQDPIGAFDANIFSPETETLALSDPMLSLAPIFGLFEWITGDSIVALNLLMFVLFVGALAAAHALAMRIFGRGDVALVVAVVACCNSYVFGQQNHPQLQTFGFLSLSFLLLLRAIEHQRIRDGIWLGLTMAAMTLATVYYGLIWAFAAVVVVAVLKLRGSLPAIRSLLRPGIAAVTTAGVFLLPVARIYLAVDERNQLTRGYEPNNSLLIRDLITPQRDNWLWGSRLDGVNSSNALGEHTYFPGFLALFLAAAGLTIAVVMLRRSARVTHTGVRLDELLALVGASIAAGILALGPSPWGLKGPFRLFHRFVPGFDGVRVTARFSVIAFIGGALLVGLAAQFLIDRTPGGWRRFVAPIIVIVVLAEVGGPMNRVDVPEGDRLLVYEALADLDEGVVLELPLYAPPDGVRWAFVEAPRMYHATTDWNPRINGYSGSTPRDFLATATTLNTFPSDSAAALINELTVQYVILHGGVEQGVPAFSEDEIVSIANEAELRGFVATQHGEDWLLTLDPPPP